MGLGETKKKQIPHPQESGVRNDTEEKNKNKNEEKEKKQIPHLPNTGRFGMTPRYVRGVQPSSVDPCGVDPNYGFGTTT